MVWIFWLMYFRERRQVSISFNAQFSSRHGREPDLDQRVLLITFSHSAQAVYFHDLYTKRVVCGPMIYM